MKALLLFVLIYTIQSYAIEDDGGTLRSKSSLMKIFPKKYNSVMHKNLNIINRRYVKIPTGVKTKKPSNNSVFTVFPPMPTNVVGIPESAYFPVDTHIEQKPRVKKVLPDYLWRPLLRRKRATATEEISKTILRKKKHKSSGKKGNKKPRKTHKKPRDRKKEHKRSKSQKGGKESRRLIAARDARIEDYPYMISIQKADRHWCSGALLNQRLAVTTANCMWKSTQVSRMQVRACSRYVDRGGQEAKIQEVMKHPQWSIRTNPDNDVALLLLDRSIKFSHHCHAADLPNRQMAPAFDDVWITSYGAERRDGIYDRTGMTLQVYHARLMDRSKCNNVTQRFGVKVSENFFCLAQTGRKAPCTRDTGAPAVSDGVVWGIASWGIRKLCGTERFPAMFSYLASQSNMDFIATATTSLMAEERHYPLPDRYKYKHPVRRNNVLV